MRQPTYAIALTSEKGHTVERLHLVTNRRRDTRPSMAGLDSYTHQVTTDPALAQTWRTIEGVNRVRDQMNTSPEIYLFEAVAVRFACEVHDAPGSCTLECLQLVENMAPVHTTDYDPTGTRYTPRDYAIETYAHSTSDRSVWHVESLTITGDQT